jgi:hypothetical protein
VLPQQLKRGHIRVTRKQNVGISLKRKTLHKTQTIDFKGFSKVGTAPAISIAQQE